MAEYTHSYNTKEKLLNVFKNNVLIAVIQEIEFTDIKSAISIINQLIDCTNSDKVIEKTYLDLHKLYKAFFNLGN